MKKPTEAIEWLKAYGLVGTFVYQEYAQEILAYIDSIPEWPADLTRERLEELADEAYSGWSNRFDALRRLAAIAPKRGKRKVDLWWHESWTDTIPPHAQYAGQSELTDGVGGWRKVGEVEIDA